MNLSRSEPLLGSGGIAALASARVAVFGLGGVGGAVCEALARAGVGALTLIDGDVFDESNLNRQILATGETIGVSKAETAARRVASINPGCRADAVARFITAEDASAFPFGEYDCVADCIDSLGPKLSVIVSALAAGTPVISSMGTGNRLFPERLGIRDVYETEGDPLARRLRHDLRAAGITSLPVVFSDEPPRLVCSPPSSVSFVPPAAGLIMAGWIVRKITGAGAL